MAVKLPILTQVSGKTIVSLSAAGGVIYNFWIFGYVLDPRAMHNTYFSVLAAPHRPYNWLFIAADSLASLLVISVGCLLWFKAGHVTKVVFGYLLFGVATLLDATVPIADKCSDSIAACGIAPSQALSFHDLASLVAYFSVFGCLLSCYGVVHKHGLRTPLARWIRSTYYGWCIAGLLLVLTIELDQLTTVSQAVFLAAIGLGIALMPAFVLSNLRAKL